MELDTKASGHGRKTETSIKADGDCLFASLQNALSKDYMIEHSIEYLKDQVLEEIIGNSKFYVRFTEYGTKKEMLEKIQAYFKHKVFTLAEVDIVVLAASTALNVNLYILSQGD